MNYDKALVVSALQIQNINLEYQTEAVSYLISSLSEVEFVIDTISDICAARYLDVILDPAKSSKVMSFSAASLSTRGYIRAIN